MQYIFPKNIKLPIKIFLVRILLLGAIFIANIPLYYELISCSFSFMCVFILFFWSIYYPILLSKFFIFLIGIIQDLITGIPLGLTSMICLILHSFIESQRKFFYKKAFIVLWVGFSMILLFYIIAYIFVISLLRQELWYSTDILWQWLFTCFVYVLMHRIFRKIHNILPYSPNV